jgi:hypothetical protein
LADKVKCGWRTSGVLLGSLLLGGCGTYRPVDVAKPSEITVEEGMREVALGIVAMRDTLKEHGARPGVLVDEATVVFNVSAASSDTSSLKIDVARPAAAGIIGISGSASDTLVASGNRGNTITIKLKNATTASINAASAEFIKYCLTHRDDPDCAIITVAPIQ